MKGPLDRFLHSSPPASSSEEKPAQPSGKGIDAGNSGRAVETSPSTAYQTGNELDQNLSGNQDYGKIVLLETSISGKIPVSRRCEQPRTSWRSDLRLIDNWNSQYKSVQLLLDHLKNHKSGSVQSARSYCLHLASFCRNVGLDPDELVKLKRRQIEEIVQRHCDNIVARGCSKQFATMAMVCLKTFFVCNGFNRENGRELRLKGYYMPSRVDSSEYVPTLKEALTMADRIGGKRNRAMILTAITSGLRNTALRALRVGDVLGELQGNKPLLIKVDPSWNQRIPGACKNSIQYHTFVAGVAANAIESMLCERKSIFGSLSPQEPLFASNYNQLPLTQRPIKPLSGEQMLVITKKAAQAADIEKWKNVCVKSMRKVFEAVLLNPLADGTQMDHKDQEFLMGHILPGSQENYYDRTKVERLRELYSKVVFEDTSHRQNMRLEVTRGIAKALGLDVSKISAIRVQELRRSLSSQEEEELLEQEIKLSRQRQNREEDKIILPSELDQYITSGWSVGLQLADGRVVVRKRPTTAL